MTIHEFNSFRRAIAYQAIEFKQGNIDKEKYLESLLVQIGSDIFKETEQIIKESREQNS
jgi:hypothetical protein